MKIIDNTFITGFELLKQKEKGPLKKVFGFAYHFMKNVESFNYVLQTNLVKFCELNSLSLFFLIKL